MEDNLRLVAEQSKMIGVRAMEQEQKLLEVKKALELKTKQLALFRHSKADQIPLNEITVLPMHLRGKFSEFLRSVLVQQKRFFEKALQEFVHKQVTDRELTFQSSPPNANGNTNLSRESLLSEIGKIGNSLALDYINELELRLNGTFSAQDTKYTLNPEKKAHPHGPNGVHNPHPSHSKGSHLEPRPMMGTHTPMGSYGSAHSGGSVGTHSQQASTDSTKVKVKTGQWFDKGKQLLASRRKKNESQSISQNSQAAPQSGGPQQSSPMPPGSAPNTTPQVEWDHVV